VCTFPVTFRLFVINFSRYAPPLLTLSVDSLFFSLESTPQLEPPSDQGPRIRTFPICKSSKGVIRCHLPFVFFLSLPCRHRGVCSCSSFTPLSFSRNFLFSSSGKIIPPLLLLLFFRDLVCSVPPPPLPEAVLGFTPANCSRVEYPHKRTVPGFPLPIYPFLFPANRFPSDIGRSVVVHPAGLRYLCVYRLPTPPCFPPPDTAQTPSLAMPFFSPPTVNYAIKSPFSSCACDRYVEERPVSRFFTDRPPSAP